MDRSDANAKAYHRSCTAKQILSGSLDVPAFASGLIGTIERLSLTGAMSQAARADEIEPGAGRDSWSMDEGDRDSFDRYEQRRGGEKESGLENYFSQAELDSRQRKYERGQTTPGGGGRVTTPMASSSSRQDLASRQSPRGGPPSNSTRDPFAAAEDEDDPAYSLDRDNALRNAGTYGFSPGGGGSITNSPKQSRKGGGGTPSDYGSSTPTGVSGRQRAGSRGAMVAGYFDDLVSSATPSSSNNKSPRSYSPLNGKRPTMGHRKSSSTFSLGRFGKSKTPPPDALLNGAPSSDSRFPEDFSRREASSSSAEDELRDRLGAMSFDNGGSSSDYNPTAGGRISPSAYLNGGLKKMTPAEAVLAAAAARSGGAASSSSSASRGPGNRASANTDAFGDLWESERERRGSSRISSSSYRPGLDELDRELQRNGSISSVESARRAAPPPPLAAHRASSYGSSSFSDAKVSRPQSSSPKFGFRTGSGGRDRSNSGSAGGILGSFRTNSGGPPTSKAASWLAGGGGERGSKLQHQTDVWAGYEDSSESEDGGHGRYAGAGYEPRSNAAWRPPSRTQSTTPRATSGAAARARVPSSVAERSPIDGNAGGDASIASSPPSSTIQPRISSLPLSDAVVVTPSATSSNRVLASFDFPGQESTDLSFVRGDVILVLRRTESTNDWWLGENERTGEQGSFPANFVEGVE